MKNWAWGLLSAVLFSALPAAAQHENQSGWFALPDFNNLVAPLGGDGLGSIPAERLRPAMDREGILNVESGSVHDHLDYDVALWLNYAWNPVTLYRRNADGSIGRPFLSEFGCPPWRRCPDAYLVRHHVGANLVGAVSLFEWVEVGVDLPVTVLQIGDQNIPGVPQHDFFFGGIGDLRIAPKVRILRAEDQFVDLAIIPAFTLSTAIPYGSYLGDGFPTFIPELALSRDILGWRMAVNTGLRFRAPSRLANVVSGQELFARAGFGYRFDAWGVPAGLEATLDTAFGIFPAPFFEPFQFNQTPLEAMAGGHWDVWSGLQLFGAVGVGLLAAPGNPDLRLLGGVRWSPRGTADRDEDGIVDDDDACPDDPEDKDGFEDSDGCPDPDNDADGVLDDPDECPNDPEDVDQFEDENGCPDLDNDGDGVPDVEDGCPLQPEDVDGFEDDNGCPDPDNDEDGVIDPDDKCPMEPGVPEAEGCPMGDSDGDGLTDDIDKCPNDPEDKDGFEDEDGCPDVDNDKDGVLDVDDKCPLDPEDKDDFEDEDGCPDPDNDKDGFLDKDDQCPNEPETINGNKDDDGCPDKGKTKVILKKEKIEILEKVYFDTAKATIKPRSFNLLGQVASILKAYGDITKVRIEGHTDSRGGDAYNKQLSDDRAKSVRQYLIDKGIAPDRLEAVGYGEERPIASNQTGQGREQNRRVEFRIVEFKGKALDNDKGQVEIETVEKIIKDAPPE